MDLVSIITPCYNSKQYLFDTFQSVINQTYKFFEWIIVDDCSTDDSFEFISNLVKNYSNIKLFKTNINGGSAVARNIGLKNSIGRYITFLDADDLIDPNYLEEQVKFIRNNGPIITAGYRRVAAQSTSNFLPRQNISYKQLLIGNDCSCLTTMYDKKVIGEVFFPENLQRHEDFVFWLNILKQGYKVRGNQSVLATYRIVQDSKNSNKRKLIKPLYLTYRKILGFNPIKSLYCLFRYILYSRKKYKNVK